MNVRNKLGPETDPFGTPKKIFRESLKFETTPVFCFYSSNTQKKLRFLSKLQALNFTSTNLVKCEVYSQMPLADL